MSGKSTTPYRTRLLDIVHVVRLQHNCAMFAACEQIAPRFRLEARSLYQLLFRDRWYVGDEPTAVASALLELEAQYKVPLKHLRACRSALRRAA